MTGQVLSPQAQADLDAIWNYTEQIWRTARAERYIRQLWQGIEQVAEEPRRGRFCDEIRAGYFKHVVGSHVVFFRLTATSIEIVRVLHGSMDFDQHL